MRNLVLTLALIFGASVAFGADLNVAVQSSDTMPVAPGATVTYQVVGELTSDADNEGLALVGFTLSFDGGDLSPADVPTTSPMNNFVVDDFDACVNCAGINNPQGYGGTVIAGDLVQVGGGQNTIMNDGLGGHPDFPVGTVIQQVAWLGAAEVLVEGTLTAPMTAGTYNLTLTDLFANVIKDGETGTPFWATEAAGVGTVTNLQIVVGDIPVCHFASSDPSDGWIDARQPLDNSQTVPDGWATIDITFNAECDASTLGAGDFMITEVCNVGNCDEVGPAVDSFVGAGNTGTLTLVAPIDPKAWTVITYVDGDAGDVIRLGYLPADADGSRTSNANDITVEVDGVALGTPLHQYDMDRSGTINANDITVVIDLLNGATPWESYQGVSLPAMP